MIVIPKPLIRKFEEIKSKRANIFDKFLILIYSSDDSRSNSEGESLNWDLTIKPQVSPFISNKSGTVKDPETFSTSSSSSSSSQKDAQPSKLINGDTPRPTSKHSSPSRHTNDSKNDNNHSNVRTSLLVNYNDY